MDPNPDPRLERAIRKAFDTFKVYPRPQNPGFCSYCNTPEELEVLRRTPLEEFDEEMGRQLTWESADHWGSTAVYKHYLPVILQWVAPPRHDEDLFPGHWVEVLKWHGIAAWSAAERGAVEEYVRSVLDLVPESEEPEIRKLRRVLSELLSLTGSGSG